MLKVWGTKEVVALLFVFFWGAASRTAAQQETIERGCVEIASFAMAAAQE